MLKNILISVGGVTAITFISKGIGFMKQVMIAGYFGSSIETDIFFLASGLVANLLYAFHTSIRTVILPAYHGKMETNINREMSGLISRILTLLIPISVLVMIIFMISAPLLSKIVASTYNNQSLETLTEYIRMIAPSLIFAVIATVFTAVLNAHRQYILPQLASTMISIVPILFILFFFKQLGIMTLVLAVPAAYFFQAVFTYFFIKKHTVLTLSFTKPNQEMKRLSLLMIPVLFGSATTQINQLADKIISSSLGAGMVSVLSYADPIEDFVTVAFSAPLLTVIFTELSSSVAKNNLEEHKFYLIRGIAMLSLLLVPVSIITILLSKDIVSLLYQRGEFTAPNVLITANVLSFYGIGFLFYSIRELVARSFYAFGDTKTPTLNGIIAVIINIILSIILSRYLGVVGIALATSIAGITSMVTLLLLLWKKLKGIELKSFYPSASKIFVSSLVMTAGILGSSHLLDSSTSILRLIVLSIVGFVLYILVLAALKCRELLDFYSFFKRKLVKRG